MGLQLELECQLRLSDVVRHQHHKPSPDLRPTPYHRHAEYGTIRLSGSCQAQRCEVLRLVIMLVDKDQWNAVTAFLNGIWML